MQVGKKKLKGSDGEIFFKGNATPVKARILQVTDVWVKYQVEDEVHLVPAIANIDRIVFGDNEDDEPTPVMG